MSGGNHESEIKELYQTILKMKSEEDLENLFNDLCTYNEINAMAGRLLAAKLLLNGETYEEIIKKADISSATLSRVSRCVKHGNGYIKALNDK